MAADPANRKPLWAIVLAACLPLAACPVAPALFVVQSGGFESTARHVEVGGPTVWLVLLAMALGAMVAGACLALSARGVRIPGAVPVFCGALPWLVGDAGLRSTLRFMLDALTHVSPGDKPVILAAGVSEALVDRWLGALVSAVLLTCIALGLGVAAVANSRAPSRPGHVIGGLAGTAMLGGALFAGVPSLMSAAVVMCTALVLAGRAASADAPHARSAALAAAVGAPVGIAFVAAAVAASLARVSGDTQALFVVDPADRLTLAIAAIDGARPFEVLTTWGWALAVAPVLAVGGWAVMRGSSVRAPVGELVAALVLVGLVAGADLSAARAVNETAESVAQRPWDATPGFHPLQVAGNDAPPSAVQVLAPGDAWLAAEAVALDARGTSQQLEQLLFDARAKKLRSIFLVGAPVRARQPSAHSPYSVGAWLVTLLQAPVAVEVRLEPPRGDQPVRLVDARGLKPQQLVDQAASAQQAGAVLQLTHP